MANENESEPELSVDLIHHPVIQAHFCVLYSIIFVVGLIGNMMVCYVVCCNKAMQTVTNVFIANLALSDILLCILAVPFTPLYFFLHRWIFGQLLCHLVAYSQGTSVYVSTFTLTSIAIDRFFVILYPFKARMKMSTCIVIVCSIWFFAICATLPYGIFVDLKVDNNTTYCDESWPSDTHRQVFGTVTTFMQFFMPFVIITIAYTKVSLKLSDRSREKARIRLKSCRGEEMDRERKRRTNRMLIAMVTIFGICWLPLNLVNLLNDLNYTLSWWKYYNLCFFVAHAIAMSSTCYNVFLYAWLNDTFRKELKRVLPCLRTAATDERRPAKLETRDNSLKKAIAIKSQKNHQVEAQVLLPRDVDHKIPEAIELTSIHFNKTLLDTSTCPQCMTTTATSFVNYDEIIAASTRTRNAAMNPVITENSTDFQNNKDIMNRR